MGQVLITEEYLQNMADALREKTGTSDPIAPKDFATTVEEIPVGPTPPPTPVDPADPTGVQYGAVLYYKNPKQGRTICGFRMGMLNSFDQDKLDTFFQAYPPANSYFMYDGNSGGWMYDYNDAGGNWQNMTIPDAMFEQMTGINFTKDESLGEWAMERPEVDFTSTDVYYPADDEVEWAICASQAEYDSLAATGRENQSWTIGGKSIASPFMFKRFVFGSLPTTTPGSMFYGTTLRTIGQIPANITSISGSFLGNCWLFNNALTIPATVTSIGQGFLTNCHSFNSALTFPSNGALTLGGYSMSSMDNFNQPLDFTGVTSIGVECFCNCNKFASNVTLPFTLVSIGYQFARGNSNFTGTVYCEAPASISVGDENFGFFYNENQDGAIFTEGYKVTGTYKQQWYDMYPPSDAYPFRKVTII